MAPTLFSASAPATVMLFGEHAVLKDKRAIVCAVDKRISITLIPRADRLITIESALGNSRISLDSFLIEKPFQFVLAAIEILKTDVSLGFDLSIESEFGDKEGLGSSAAVTVATITVLKQYITSTKQKTFTLNEREIFELAKSVVLKVQGIASGADVAASVYGGLICYQQQHIENLNHFPPLTLVYSGDKVKTIDVIKQVSKKETQYPLLFHKLYETIESTTLEAISAIQEKNWFKLGEIMNCAQGLMVSLSLSTPLLNQLIDKLKNDKNIHGAKISGSGLGDCIVGIGYCDANLFCDNEKEYQLGVRQIPIKIASQGVFYAQ